MQTTLLATAIALILALLAALIGPYFIDWTQYRTTLEAQAARYVGAPVRLSGAIDIRLLPVPSLVARDVEVGKSGELRARQVSIEFSFAPILRGEWHATEVRLVGAAAHLGLDAGGRLNWGADLSGMQPDALSVERLVIEDGEAVLTDAASGGRLDLTRVWFIGDAKSLLGPVKGEGGFTFDDAHYGYRLALARRSEEGSKIRLQLDPVDQRLSLEADGMVRLGQGAPRFEGRLSVTRTAVPVAPSRAGEIVWRVSAERVRAQPARAVIEDAQIQFGPDERAIRLTGAADLRLGADPGLDGVFSARQADLDRLLVRANAQPLVPLEAVRLLAGSWDRALARSVPARLGISVESLTLAGALLQNVRADLAADAEGWSVEQLELRAPGRTLLRASGRISDSADGGGFQGPARIEAADARALLAWVEGRSERSNAGLASLRASGDVFIGPGRAAVDRLSFEFDGKPVEGRLAYFEAGEGRPARIEAALRAADIDLDAMTTSLRSAFGPASRAPPGEAVLSLEFEQARLFGTQAKRVSADMRLDDKGLAVERFAIGDLGGASLAARGRIEGPMSSPQGALSLDIDATAVEGLAAALATLAPEWAERVRRLGARLAPLKTRLTVALERDAGATGSSRARLGIEGRAGLLRVGVVGDATGDFAALDASDWRVDARLDADDGTVLAELLAFDRTFAIDRRPAWTRVVASRSGNKDMHVDARLVGGGIEVSSKGTLGAFPWLRRSGALTVSLTAADAGSLLREIASLEAGPLPVVLKLRASVEGDSFIFDEIDGRIGSSALRGQLRLLTGSPMHVTGRLQTDALDAAALIAAASGLSGRWRRGDSWSADLFVSRVAELSGEVDIRAGRAPVGSYFTARDLRATLRFGDNGLVIDGIEGMLGGGRLSARLAFSHRADGLNVQSRVALRGAEIAFQPTQDARVAGKVTLEGEFEGAGLSPAALIGGLSGGATFSIERGEITGLDPRVFDAAIRAADRGAVPNASALAPLVMAALESGRFAFAKAGGALSVSAGQVRIAPMLMQGAGARLQTSGLVDLVGGQVDVRHRLSGAADPTLGTEPEVIALLKGPLSAPTQSADVSTLLAWLTLRAVERQARRLEYLEGSRPAGDKPAPPRPATVPDESRAPAATKSGELPPTGTAYAPAAQDQQLSSEQAPPLPPPIEIGPAPGAQPRRPLPRPAGGVAPAPRRERTTAPLPINPSAWPGGAPGSGLQR